MEFVLKILIWHVKVKVLQGDKIEHFRRFISKKKIVGMWHTSFVLDTAISFHGDKNMLGGSVLIWLLHI